MYKNKVFCLFLSVLIMFIFISSNNNVGASVKDSLEKKIEQNKEKINDVKTSISEIEQEIDIVDDELSKIKNEVDQRNKIINEYVENIEFHQKNIDEKNLLIESVLKEIEITEAKVLELNTELQKREEELKKLDKLLGERIREFYKYSQNNSLGLDLFLVMIFDMNKDLQEVLDTVHSISKITESDKKLIENIRQIKDDLNRDKESLKKEVLNLDLYKKDLEKQIYEIDNIKASLENKKLELENELQKVKVLEDEYQEKYNSLDEISKQKRDELLRIQEDNEELQKQLREYMNSINNSGFVGGTNGVSPSGYIRPSTGPITSHFGTRVHPVRKTKSTHSGVDFGASYGDSIIASRAGDVAFAGWYNNVYGNVVILNHGGGYQTFYAHMSRVNVSKGQVVDQGQKIGFVGSTGLSTGAHVHFEVRKDGHSLNPLNFLTR